MSGQRGAAKFSDIIDPETGAAKFSDIIEPDPRKRQELEGVPDLRSIPERMGKGLARTLLPSITPGDYLEGPRYAMQHPWDSLDLIINAIKDATMNQGHKAAEAVRATMAPGPTGDRLASGSRAVGHTLAAAVPVFGPAVAHAGELIGEGDIAGGIGEGMGLLAPTLVPRAAGAIKAKIPAAIKTRGIRGLNPAEAAAVEAGQRAGIRVDAGTATGNQFVQGLQAVVDHTPIGGVIANKVKKQNAQGLATMGEQLAARGHSRPVTEEQAGTAAQQGVRDVVSARRQDANKEYTRLREIEADPTNTRSIEQPPEQPREGSRAMFTIKQRASPNEIFDSALQDAREGGYTGSTTALREQFNERMNSARRLKRETEGTTQEYGPQEFLKSIRELGGLKPYEKSFRAGAPAEKLTGEFDRVKWLFKGRGASSVFREDGLALDDMVMQLRQDPRWAHMLTDESDLISVLDELGRTAPDAINQGRHGAHDLQHYLSATGVEPGLTWWEAGKGPQVVKLPVALADAKAALKPTYEALRREGEIAPLAGSKATAARALDRLMNAPDHAPLSVVDAALGELKSFARSDNPDLRSIGQGVVAKTVQQLDAAVRAAATGAGPEAIGSLERGRAATVAKYEAAKVLKALKTGTGEPVRAFGRLTAREDSGVAHLRDVVQQAPAVAPQIGRAVLDGLLDKAKAGGGFDKGGTLWADWQRLGTETKSILFKDPAYIRDLDNFFMLAKKLAERPNPSGTALTSAAGASALGALLHPLTGGVTVAVAGGLSKFLHSRAGVRLLTEGVNIPLTRPRAVTAWQARLRVFARAAAQTSVAAGRVQTAATPSGQ